MFQSRPEDIWAVVLCQAPFFILESSSAFATEFSVSAAEHDMTQLLGVTEEANKFNAASLALITQAAAKGNCFHTVLRLRCDHHDELDGTNPHTTVTIQPYSVHGYAVRSAASLPVPGAAKQPNPHLSASLHGYAHRHDPEPHIQHFCF